MVYCDVTPGPKKAGRTYVIAAAIAVGLAVLLVGWLNGAPSASVQLALLRATQPLHTPTQAPQAVYSTLRAFPITLFELHARGYPGQQLNAATTLAGASSGHPFGWPATSIASRTSTRASGLIPMLLLAIVGGIGTGGLLGILGRNWRRSAALSRDWSMAAMSDSDAESASGHTSVRIREESLMDLDRLRWGTTDSERFALFEDTVQRLSSMKAADRRLLKQSASTYSAVFICGTAVGATVYPLCISLVKALDPAIATLSLDELAKPLGLLITALAVSASNLQSTALGFQFNRLRSIRELLYDEAALLGILMSDLLLLLEDHPKEREVAFTRLLQHTRSIYYATDEARANPANKLEFIYVPGLIAPFDDPLLRLLRQINKFSTAQNLRQPTDAFVANTTTSIKALAAKRDARVSWEKASIPPALLYALVTLNLLFFGAYLLMTANLQYAGYQVFFGLLVGLVSILYLILYDLDGVTSGSFTVNGGLSIDEEGTIPILKPAMDTITYFLDDARKNVRSVPNVSASQPSFKGLGRFRVVFSILSWLRTKA